MAIRLKIVENPKNNFTITYPPGTLDDINSLLSKSGNTGCDHNIVEREIKLNALKPYKKFFSKLKSQEFCTKFKNIDFQYLLNRSYTISDFDKWASNKENKDRILPMIEC